MNDARITLSVSEGEMEIRRRLGREIRRGDILKAAAIDSGERQCPL